MIDSSLDRSAAHPNSALLQKGSNHLVFDFRQQKITEQTSKKMTEETTTLLVPTTTWAQRGTKGMNKLVLGPRTTRSLIVNNIHVSSPFLSFSNCVFTVNHHFWWQKAVHCHPLHRETLSVFILQKTPHRKERSEKLTRLSFYKPGLKF